MTLGGVLFCYNAIIHDYCVEEAISSLLEVCDEILILDAGSTDGTTELLTKFVSSKCVVVQLGKEEWEKRHGREKLSYFQNLAKAMLTTDYYFLLQADEVLSEESFYFIKDAIAMNQEAYFVKRINLWGDCNSFINVPENRQPCSTQIIRLAKINYVSVGDGESIDAPAKEWFIDKIKIFHYGFVRKKEVMKSKIINMQENVFELGYHDPKLDQSNVFDSTLWFKGDELSPLKDKHPKFITEWINTRP